jgi:hypothetical protein
VFARTFALNAKNLDFENARAVISLIEEHLIKDLSGRRPFAFRLFVDLDKEAKKLVFYDTTAPEHVMEFSGVYCRLPELSIEFDAKTLKIYRFHEEHGSAKIFNAVVDGGVIRSLTADEATSAEESKSLRDVACATSGFFDVAGSLDGIVSCSVVEDTTTNERMPFFTVKVDDQSAKNRAVVRSCEDMRFAWSDERSFMVLMCRFKMLPPFAITLPIMGRNIPESMELYITHQKAVGMAMYTDDVSDSFRIEKGRPTFEHT